jgi:parallel beta-helix repeat protein
MRKLFGLLLAGMLALWLASGCSSALPFPTTQPTLTIPDAFELSGPLTIIENQPVTIDSNIANYSFQDCEIQIVGDDLTITNCGFINSPVSVANRSNITFDGVIFANLAQNERAALNCYSSHNLVIINCQFINNYIGLGIHCSTAQVLGNRFEGNNGHNALLIGEGSSVEVTGNYFYGSFPHAILILNREGSPEASVNISYNFIAQTGQDAIDFEDYLNAAPSTVSHNVIINTGWSAVVVEYNSWQSSITIESNWIEATGIDWQLPVHPLQPEPFQPGWAHGILVEDSSQVQIINNRILAAPQNGIEVTNSREIVVQGNGIDCSLAGIGVHQYQQASLYRSFSPLAPENADGSQVTASDNIIYQAQRDYDVDEESQLVIQ